LKTWPTSPADFAPSRLRSSLGKAGQWAIYRPCVPSIWAGGGDVG
jgi:hypothetical protein